MVSMPPPPVGENMRLIERGSGVAASWSRRHSPDLPWAVASSRSSAADGPRPLLRQCLDAIAGGTGCVARVCMLANPRTRARHTPGSRSQPPAVRRRSVRRASPQRRLRRQPTGTRRRRARSQQSHQPREVSLKRRRARALKKPDPNVLVWHLLQVRNSSGEDGNARATVTFDTAE
jgi:hypothetical protein